MAKVYPVLPDIVADDVERRKRFEAFLCLQGFEYGDKLPPRWDLGDSLRDLYQLGQDILCAAEAGAICFPREWEQDEKSRLLMQIAKQYGLRRIIED